MWFGFLCILSFVASASLNCVPCKDVECNRVPSDCPVGVTKDPCGCCGVCAKNLGEPCGGPFNSYGTCGIDLVCDLGDFPPNEDPRDYADAPIGKCIVGRRMTTTTSSPDFTVPDILQ
ncbi:venom protein 302-like [Centruroides vittatus]|uniref:venom protein 302-like n=1 Tax=Centruroides vittatus TaxID=120091 RepID=UPI00351055E8